MKNIVILGAGFGGLELATRLQELLPGEVRITLIDKNDFFIVGFAKFDVLFGRKTAEEIKSYYRDLPNEVHFRQEEIQLIDPEKRRVVTSGGTYDADMLVVALGAEMDLVATPGFAEGGQEFYTLRGVERLRKVLPTFDSGVALIAILGMPYKCPPAPFEAALQFHDHLMARKIQDKVKIRVLSPTPNPLPVSKEGSEAISRLLNERGIEFLPGHLVTSIDPESKQATVTDKGTIPYDLFMGVPVHRVPAVVEEAGLIEGGWIPVNRTNLETRFPNVFAIGDVTKIPVGAGAVPKAGAFADRAARSVADEIAYRISGKGSPANFDAVGTCFLEFGAGNVAKIEANFLGGPAPDVRFVGPSKDFLPDKDAFSNNRLQRWFRK